MKSIMGYKIPKQSQEETYPPPEPNQYVGLKEDCSTPCVPSSPLDELDSEIQSLEKAVNILISEIQPFLNPNQLDKDCGRVPDDKECSHSPFVAHLRSRTYTLACLRRKVENTKSQLEF